VNEFFGLDYIETFGKITGAIHIGAHHAEERNEYKDHGIPVIWFEAHPEYAAIMQKHLRRHDNQIGIELLLSDTDGDVVDFYITNDEFASSMLKPAMHQDFHPQAQTVGVIQLETHRFDSIVDDIPADIGDYNFLVLDVQGAELKVLRGIGPHLGGFDIICSEYSTIEYYEGVPHLLDIDDYLSDYTRVFPVDPGIHGDALYVRNQ
jgi:FkbM family methyltransferase